MVYLRQRTYNVSALFTLVLDVKMKSQISVTSNFSTSPTHAFYKIYVLCKSFLLFWIITLTSSTIK